MSIDGSIGATVRYFNNSDAGAVVDIAVDNFNHVMSKVYPPASIEFLIERWTPQSIQQISTESDRTILVAEYNGQVVGVAGLKQDDVRMVFVSRNIQEKGIGRALIARIESIAVKKGLGELTVSSTINAEGFYNRMGFQRLQLEESKIGEIIRMKKQIPKDQ